MYEILTVAEMAMADKRAIEAGVASVTLMENAGRAVSDAAAAMVRPGAVVVVLTGPGNNGGDGFVAARHLKQNGFDVRIAALVPVEKLKGDAAAMAKRWDGPTSPFEPQSLSGANLVIDAIFGAGLNRDVPADVGRMIASAMRQAIPVLAIDVPTGVDGDTGTIRGIAFRATRTITFARRKFGHVLFPGRDLCGEITVADIGIADSIIASLNCEARVNSAPSWSQPLYDTHKYRRGHALIVSGPPHQTGAARLTARAALRAGAGAVTLATTQDALAINAAHLTAIMLKPYRDAAAFHDIVAADDHQSIVIGPGLAVGAETRALVRSTLETGCERYVILDAGALTSFEADRDALFKMTSAIGYAIMTPHEGEFARLFGELPGSKVDRARKAADISGATIVLKGADTVIADRYGGVTVNINAPPTLATAGSGDVLAGFIAGITSQGMSSNPAACAAVWLHSECANVFGPGLIAEDLPDVLPGVLKKLRT